MSFLSGFFRRYRYQLFLLVAGLFVLESVNFILQLDRQTFLYPDAGNYLESSRSLFTLHRLHDYRPMVMAFANGLPYVFGGDDVAVLQWSLLVNVFCWLGSGLLVFAITSELAGPRKAFWLALFFFTIPGCIALLYHLLAETLFMYCLLLAVRLFQLNEARSDRRFLGWALAVLVLSIMVKPVAFWLAVAAIVWFIPSIVQHRKKAMLPLYGALVVLVVQMGGMRQQFGNFTVSYIDGVTLYNYLLSRARCEEAGTEFRQEANPRATYLLALLPKARKAKASADLRLQLKENLPNIVKAYVGNQMNNASHGSYAIKDCRNERKTSYFASVQAGCYQFSIWQNRIMTPIGFLIASWLLLTFRHRPFYVSFCAFAVVYIVMVSGISCGQGDRFFTPLYPFYLIVFGTFLWFIPSSAPPRTTFRPHT